MGKLVGALALCCIAVVLSVTVLRGAEAEDPSVGGDEPVPVG
jgi:hypothetical protein